jgi:glycolate oxidase subunit GlcD
MSIANALEQMAKIVTPAGVKTDPSSLSSYGVDWTKDFKPAPSAIVFPRSTNDVQQIIQVCANERVALVPSGGRTGLAGGAVAEKGEIVVSLEKMDKISEPDTIGLTLEVQAGAITEKVHAAAEQAGLFFGLDLAAKGSSQIGGNIATNAGGLKFIRYGGMREQVLGLEVVTGDGIIRDYGKVIRKNNVGYDLKQLFIGSEGTLGIITKAVIKLHQKPKNLRVMLASCDKFASIPALLHVCNQKGLSLTAYEFFDAASLDLVLTQQTQVRSPFSEKPHYCGLIEFESDAANDAIAEAIVEHAVEAGLVNDAFLSSSDKEFKEFWSMRELISESASKVGHVRKNDISVPIHRLREFVPSLSDIVQLQGDGLQIVIFGHIGDGNLHINYLAPKTLDVQVFHQKARQCEEKVFEEVTKLGGSISAEHGIGLLKKKDLHRSVDDVDIATMKQIKAMFDPHGILNPGKIFD